MNFLGIDTSCYTTSICLLAEDGSLLADKRRVLDVPPKQRGLLQSEALFQHIHNIPLLLQELSDEYDLKDIKAVGASVKPRPVEDSYMPVFTGSESFGQSLAACLGIPFLPFSHQEGHLMAALHSLGRSEDFAGEFLFCHCSGGTSEILLAKDKNPGYGLELKAFGNDLHAGQLIDRIGVLLGLPFPCGKHLEKLAKEAGNKDIPKIKIWAGDGEFSFSGQETAIRRLYEGGTEDSVCCRAAEEVVAATLIKSFKEQFERTGLDTALLAGGVMSNAYIRSRIAKAFPAKHIYFAEPAFASDNALGIAGLTRLSFIKK